MDKAVQSAEMHLERFHGLTEAKIAKCLALEELNDKNVAQMVGQADQSTIIKTMAPVLFDALAATYHGHPDRATIALQFAERAEQRGHDYVAVQWYKVHHLLTGSDSTLRAHLILKLNVHNYNKVFAEDKRVPAELVTMGLGHLTALGKRYASTEYHLGNAFAVFTQTRHHAGLRRTLTLALKYGRLKLAEAIATLLETKLTRAQWARGARGCIKHLDDQMQDQLLKTLLDHKLRELYKPYLANLIRTGLDWSRIKERAKKLHVKLTHAQQRKMLKDAMKAYRYRDALNMLKKIPLSSKDRVRYLTDLRAHFLAFGIVDLAEICGRRIGEPLTVAELEYQHRQYRNDDREYHQKQAAYAYKLMIRRIRQASNAATV